MIRQAFFKSLGKNFSGQHTVFSFFSSFDFPFVSPPDFSLGIPKKFRNLLEACFFAGSGGAAARSGINEAGSAATAVGSGVGTVVLGIVSVGLDAVAVVHVLRRPPVKPCTNMTLMERQTISDLKD